MPLEFTFAPISFRHYLKSNLDRFGIKQGNPNAATGEYHNFWFGDWSCQQFDILSEEPNTVYVYTPEIKPDLSWLEELINAYNVVLEQRGLIQPVEVKLWYHVPEKKEDE